MIHYTATVPASAATIRPRGGWSFARYSLLDRGSYEYANDVDEPELAALAVSEVERLTDWKPRVVEARVLRLGAGDYVLAHHDRVLDESHIEVMIDLSPHAVPDAEVHYRQRGQVYFRTVSEPGTLWIVRRTPAVRCNHTYISKRYLDASVVRLVLLLRV